jgi:anaerobic selenocysteine-containing dehydrogenase
MTLRSEGQFNTVVYDEEDLYRGNSRRDVVMMSREDAERLAVAEGDRVSVETRAGRMRVVVSVVDIRPGNLAMYYPEANRLVPRDIDAATGTPAFKSMLARVETT